ncbi:MAG: DUF4105 domain-containing protein [Mariniblastus sp.]|nr:DUF4105 domain-containing protein [Mariniblastus sp.]
MWLVFYIVVVVYLLAVVAWVGGALFNDLAKRKAVGWVLVGSWLVFVAAMLFLIQSLTVFVIAISVLAVIAIFIWLTQKPSHDRQWEPNSSVLPRFEINGDRIVAIDVRNSQYRSATDYDLCHEDREYRISELVGVDAAIVFWGSELICHPMAIFDFGNDRHLCISIEARYQVGQPYDVFRSIYRQYEIMYVVSDERDAILRRIKFSQGDFYLYRMQTDREFAQKLFLEYVEATNKLFDRPKWYHGLVTNCSTTIMFQRKEKVRWSWRMFINGTFDRLLYERGFLFDEISFQELKARSKINDLARPLELEDFSRTIRKDLPGFEQPDPANEGR